MRVQRVPARSMTQSMCSIVLFTPRAFQWYRGLWGSDVIFKNHNPF